MAQRTQRERLQAAIIAKGGKEHKVTGKSIVMTYPGLDGFLYLGKAGSLRAGKNKTDSIPYDRLKARLLAEQK
jgi:hypothetical protein